jgi:hypothetical protein
MRIMAAAANCPLGGISAYVNNFFRFIGKYNRKGFFKNYIRIKMIKAKPTLLYLFRQSRKNLLNSFSFAAENLKSQGFPFLY